MEQNKLDDLTKWVKQYYSSDFSIEKASSDASFRSYYRVISQDDTKIIMDAPPKHEPLTSFLDITKRLSTAGLNVPVIHEVDDSKGYILMSDLGKKIYLDALNKETVYCLYTDAIDALCHIQNRVSSDDLKKFDMKEQLIEMQLFSDWFINKHLKIELSHEQEDTLEQCYTEIAKTLLDIPQTFIHRDFHSRNLMITNKNNPGILDYQDALIGPLTYDLVSLLKDCYIDWDDEITYKMMGSYLQRLNKDVVMDHSQFEYWFDITGVQRHLKAIGIFSRLNYRDKKSIYLNDIPRTYKYIETIATKYPEMSKLKKLLLEINIKEAL